MAVRHMWRVARVQSIANGVYDLKLEPWGDLNWRLAPNMLHGSVLADDKTDALLTRFLLEGDNCHGMLVLLEPPSEITLARLRVQVAVEGIANG